MPWNDSLHTTQDFVAPKKYAPLSKSIFSFTDGLLPSDITICVVDCGADVQAVANVFNWFSFPCLAKIVNLCARKFILEIDEERGQEIESDDDEDESDTTNVNETTNNDLYVDVIK